MAPKSVTFQRHDHLVSVLFGDLLSHSYNITFSMFLYLVYNYYVSIGIIGWPIGLDYQIECMGNTRWLITVPG